MIDASWYRRPAGARERLSAGGVVVRVERGDILVALVAEVGFSAHVLPKGGVDAGESLEQAARREIREEAGLADLRLLDTLGVGERLNFRKTTWGKTTYFLFLTAQVEGAPSDAGHDYRLVWRPLDQLPKMMWPEQRELLETRRERIRGLVRVAVADARRT